MAKSSGISRFTTTGKKVAGQSGTGKLASFGTFDPTTGKVYQHPRIKANPLAGSSVRVTAPKASYTQTQRTASLGMGAVGQRAKNPAGPEL